MRHIQVTHYVCVCVLKRGFTLPQLTTNTHPRAIRATASTSRWTTWGVPKRCQQHGADGPLLTLWLRWVGGNLTHPATTAASDVRTTRRHSCRPTWAPSKPLRVSRPGASPAAAPSSHCIPPCQLLTTSTSHFTMALASRQVCGCSAAVWRQRWLQQCLCLCPTCLHTHTGASGAAIVRCWAIIGLQHSTTHNT